MGTRTHIARMRGWSTASGMICCYPMNTGNYRISILVHRKLSEWKMRISTRRMRIFCQNSKYTIYLPKPNNVIKCFIIQNTRLVVAPLDDLYTSTQLCQKSVLSNSSLLLLCTEKRKQNKNNIECENGENTSFPEWSSESSEIQAYTNTNGQRISSVMSLSRKNRTIYTLLASTFVSGLITLG